jgi:hypothetical protein
MNSSLKLKFNQQTGQTELTNADGQDLLKIFPYIQDISINITNTGLPKIVITCTCLDFLEFETDAANIEKKTVQLGYIKENQDTKVEKYENKLRSQELQKAFTKEFNNG